VLHAAPLFAGRWAARGTLPNPFLLFPTFVEGPARTFSFASSSARSILASGTGCRDVSHFKGVFPAFFLQRPFLTMLYFPVGFSLYLFFFGYPWYSFRPGQSFDILRRPFSFSSPLFSDFVTPRQSSVFFSRQLKRGSPP